jgi:hypothetical protein
MAVQINLEKMEGTIENGQSREIGNISCAHKTQDEDKGKQNTTQHVRDITYANNTNNVNKT